MGRKTRLPSLHIVFGGPTGKPTSEVVLPAYNGPAIRRFDHGTWDRDQAIRKFSSYLARGDQEGIEASHDALVRLGCLAEALQLCARGQRPNRRKTETLLHLWNSRGRWSLPRSLGNDLAIFTDAIRYFAPPYNGDALTLYRGQSLSRYESGVFGIAWTTRLEIAEQFACGRETPGVVLELHASPDLIVARVPDIISTPKTNPQSQNEFEDEYLIDPRAITGLVRVHSRGTAG